MCRGCIRRRPPPTTGVEERRQGGPDPQMIQVGPNHLFAQSEEKGREWWRSEEEKEQHRESRIKNQQEQENEEDKEVYTMRQKRLKSSSSSSHDDEQWKNERDISTVVNSSLPAAESSMATERPTKRQKRMFGPETIESTAATASAKSSGSALIADKDEEDHASLLPVNLKESLDGIRNPQLESSVDILERFLFAAVQNQQLDPNEKVTQVINDVQTQVPFIIALLQAHKKIDQHGRLLRRMYQPYRTQLKSLIRRASTTELTIKYGQVTPNCTLLQYVIYAWTINNTEHVAYDWLCGLLETPHYPIDAIDCHGESALSSWSQNDGITSGLVFHTLIRAGARTDRLDKSGRSFMQHLFDHSLFSVIRELLAYGYESICLDALFQTWIKSELLPDTLEVWKMMMPFEEEEAEENAKGRQNDGANKTVRANDNTTQPILEEKKSAVDIMTIVEIKEQPNEDGECENDPETLIISMRNIWLSRYRSHILSMLTSRHDGKSTDSTSSSSGNINMISDDYDISIEMVPDCALLCVEYLDGSGRSWVGTNTFNSENETPTSVAVAMSDER